MPREEVQSALEDLREEAVLPHPVRLRDLILKSKLDPALALEVNREFQDYLTQFGQAQKNRRAPARAHRRKRAQELTPVCRA
jgi:hypothetical protein